MFFPKHMLALAAGCVAVVSAGAQPPPVLTWVTNQTVKLEQVIGDVDWAALAQGSNVPTTSLTASRFHIYGTDNGGSFENNGKLMVLFGDTIPDTNTWNYHAADPFAWSTNTDGDSGLLLNFYTNRPFAFSNNWPAFVQPTGIDMSGNCVPKCGIVLSNGTYVICNTGSDSKHTNNPHWSDYSVLLTYNESNLLALTNTYLNTNLIFFTNRTISALNTNLDPTNAMQGHFIFTSIHGFGTNVVMFGTGEFRASDIYLSMVPAANFVSGAGTMYFTGLSNGLPTWSQFESNSVPVVQDNPTNGPPWPNDTPSAGDISIINPPGLGLWLMTYDGGRNTDHPKQTTGIYFSYAPAPWGPWSAPQLIFNANRDLGRGVFIFDADTQTGPAGPVIDPSNNNPTNTPGAVYGPYMIERFTRVTNGNLFIYYTMSTWNPYTVVKMRSQFTIRPVIDPASIVQTANMFTFTWLAPTDEAFQVDYAAGMPPSWSTFTNIVTSTNGSFKFTDDEKPNGGLPPSRFYRVHTAQ